MIIPALVNYYERLEADPESGIAPFGWSRQKMSFRVVIERAGRFKGVEDARTEVAAGKKTYRKPVLMTVPGQSKPTGRGFNPCFLWDNAAYMLGLAVDDGSSSKKIDTKRIRQSFEAFRERHLALQKEIDDGQFDAVCKFLKAWDPAEHKEIAKELAEYMPGFGVFLVRGEMRCVHEHKPIKRYWNASLGKREDADEDSRVFAPSLMTGRAEPLARLHEPKIKGVNGAQSSGAALVSFNLGAFESYGKSQSYNAPLGDRDAFRYCTALNHLLEQPDRKALIGEDTYVFWAEKPAPLEDSFLSLILMGQQMAARENKDQDGSADAEKDANPKHAASEDRATVNQIESLLRIIRTGADPRQELGDPGTRFFILALSPNASRLHQRLWLDSTVGELTKQLKSHYDALELDGAPDGYRPPSIKEIVGETLPAKDGWPEHERADKGLVAEVARAILTGRPYPLRLLSGVIDRVRNEGFADPDRRYFARAVAHRRASIIKAWLLSHRSIAPSIPEIPVSLNTQHPSAAYQVGRLFAVLEKTQEDASGGKLNKTIKDGYFASASSAPAAVLPRLLALHAHHLRQIEHRGHRVNIEKQVCEIQSRIENGYPPFLDLRERGLFFLGYYHQRSDIFTKKDSPQERET